MGHSEGWKPQKVGGGGFVPGESALRTGICATLPKMRPNHGFGPHEPKMGSGVGKRAQNGPKWPMVRPYYPVYYPYYPWSAVLIRVRVTKQGFFRSQSVYTVSAVTRRHWGFFREFWPIGTAFALRNFCTFCTFEVRSPAVAIRDLLDLGVWKLRKISRPPEVGQKCRKSGFSWSCPQEAPADQI